MCIALLVIISGLSFTAQLVAPPQVWAEALSRGSMKVVWAANDSGDGSRNLTAWMTIAGSTLKSLSTNFTLVNLSAGSNTVNISYYKPDGSQWRAPENLTFAAQGDQVIRRQYTDPALSAGSGSVVIGGQGALGAVVQIQTRVGTATRAAYVGVEAGAPQAYVPYLAKGLASASGTVNSQVIVQNVTGSPINVTIDLIGATTSAVVATHAINNLAAGASQMYDLADDAAVPAGFYGSAVAHVVGTGEIAAIANIFSGPDTLQTYNAFPSTAQAWIAPLFTSRLANSLSTPIAVQNLSGGVIPPGGINVTCTQDPASPGPATFTVSNPSVVPQYVTYFFNPVTNLAMPGGWFGSCRIVTAGYNTVAFVQMRVVNGAQAGAYEAIKADGTRKKVVVPLYAKRLATGFASVVTIQNLNASATANVTMQYKGGAGAPANCTATVTAQIAPSGSLQQNHRVQSGPQSVPAIGDQCYGTIVVTSDQPIDGIVQLTDIAGTPGDTFQVHNVFTID
jgi:hypothetical protein